MANYKPMYAVLLRLVLGAKIPEKRKDYFCCEVGPSGTALQSGDI